jgi:hypothetical protein
MVNMSALNAGTPTTMDTRMGTVAPLSRKSSGSCTNITSGTVMSDQTVMECSTVTAAISAVTMRHPSSG